MKACVIIVLAAVNVALLLALVLGPGAQPAAAQAGRGAPDYMAITGKIGGQDEAIYIIETTKRQMQGWRFDRNAKRLVPFQVRALERDFPIAGGGK